jgi:diaminopimelate epimerase
VRFSRWHALGNRYVVAPRAEAGELDPERAREISADGDGVVEVVAVGDAELEVVIWNPDGSTAEMSGNGTRIAAAWLSRQTGATDMRVLLGPREVRCRVLADGRIEQDLGAVEVGAPETVDGISFVPVSVGNPHAVVIGDPADVERVGRLLESHARFPQRTNVELVRVDGRGEVTARIWERGVGETRASGTGAVAAAAGTHDDGEVLVHFPGGDLLVRLAEGRASLTGPAEPVERDAP